MKLTVFFIALCAFVFQSSVVVAENDRGGDGGGYIPLKPESWGTFSSDPSVFIEPSNGMSDSSAETFSLTELVGTSVNGMLEDDCGGYCIVGFCAHLKIGFSLSKGIYYYTIISPKIEHAMADLLVSSYDDEGGEPLQEWRDSAGRLIGATNDQIANTMNSPDGLQGGRSDPLEQGEHQTISFKEVDIIGHPLAMLPGLVNSGSSPSFTGYKIPDYQLGVSRKRKNPNNATLNGLSEGGMSFNPSELETSDINSATSLVKNSVAGAIQALNPAEKVDDLATAAQTIKNIRKVLSVMLTASETTVRGSVVGNFLSPRFRAPNLFCPTDVKAFQPYYLTFADSFWWRSGYPLTDGPISGTDHSSTVVNPFSTDTLQTTSGVAGLATNEIWGRLYPRDGTINQSHDAKTASVLAWRAMDVLHTAVKTGHRVGVTLPTSATSPKWQLIFPEVKNCRADPYYPQGADLTIDSLMPSGHGGYAWNYYRTYNCCSNTSGRKLTEAPLPKICLPLSGVLAGIEEDRAAHVAYLEEKRRQEGQDQRGDR